MEAIINNNDKEEFFLYNIATNESKAYTRSELNTWEFANEAQNNDPDNTVNIRFGNKAKHINIELNSFKELLIWLGDREEFERNFPEEEFPDEDGTVTIEIDYELSQEDHLTMLEEICSISKDCEDLEKQMKGYQSLASTARKERDEKMQLIYDLIHKKELGKERRLVHAKIEYDWENNQKKYLDPDSLALLKEEAIPHSDRQSKLEFEPKKNGTVKKIENNDLRETWYDHLRNFDFIDRPKGVTDLRLDKIKEQTKADRRFLDLIKEAGEPQHSAEYTQKMMALQFFNISKDILYEEGVLG
jgi:hypothetical protein